MKRAQGSLTASNRSMAGACRRMSASARSRYGGSRPSRNSSSPCSVQQTGRPNTRLSGVASAMSSEFGRSMTSGEGGGRRPAPAPPPGLLDLLAQHAVLALEHRDRQIPQRARVGGDGAPGDGADHPRRVPEPIEQSRSLPEERHVLLEVDAD